MSNLAAPLPFEHTVTHFTLTNNHEYRDFAGGIGVEGWCPEGWVDTGGSQCMKLYDRLRPRTWLHARESCQMVGGDLYAPRGQVQKVSLHGRLYCFQNLVFQTL